MARSYHQLGMLAQDPGDYDEAARQYQRALDIFERLGDQANMALSYHQLAALAQDRGEPVAGAIALHLRALTIRLRLGMPRAVNNLVSEVRLHAWGSSGRRFKPRALAAAASATY
jgi:tetratricopeptide (TPR) repeat protein